MPTSRRPDPGRVRHLGTVLVAGPVALLAVLVLAGCGAQDGGTPGAPAPAVSADGVHRVEVDYTGGAVAGGVGRYEVPLGSTVEVVVASDVAEEVHLHGYDRSSFVTAGATTTLRFVADVPGVFEIELEQRADPLAQLEVS